MPSVYRTNVSTVGNERALRPNIETIYLCISPVEFLEDALHARTARNDQSLTTHVHMNTPSAATHKVKYVHPLMSAPTVITSIASGRVMRRHVGLKHGRGL
jgi:hypothetical protein